ncbi:mandelate racemase/muconate lactonizing enzyme family protein [Marinobacterium jannaschii]|uniref:mandelate racemase/muconate lactonizing enzyme family protein n=1 Tax=Marinobacterium jannaschii TaxID=64970 RepID=UPI0004861107|nr:mandelate racemase/muconate lactonizing enzyme family protein [Marinobacterium jannaschii]
MKINKISVFRKELRYKNGVFAWGRGNVIESSSSTVVVLETDSGLTGVGEFCPCGENYMVAHGEGTEAAARLIAPRLLGQDPREIGKIERIMDNTILGHGYAKAPFDAACWDIFGKSIEQPLWMLLGGKMVEGAPMYRSVPQCDLEDIESNVEALRQQGYRQFQIKVGNDWKSDIERIHAVTSYLQPGEKAIADANQGWYMDEAIKVGRATRGLDYIIEQPCHSYEECYQVRAAFEQPMKLDECIVDLRMAERAVQDMACEYVCLKLSKQGGLSKAKKMRDYLIDHRIKVVSEDTWGGEIATSVVAHFAASTPEEFLLNTTDLYSYNIERTGLPGPQVKDGKLYTIDGIGLGVEPDYDSLGEPVAVYQ